MVPWYNGAVVPVRHHQDVAEMPIANCKYKRQKQLAALCMHLCIHLHQLAVCTCICIPHAALCICCTTTTRLCWRRQETNTIQNSQQKRVVWHVYACMCTLDVVDCNLQAQKSGQTLRQPLGQIDGQMQETCMCIYTLTYVHVYTHACASEGEHIYTHYVYTYTHTWGPKSRDEASHRLSKRHANTLIDTCNACIYTYPDTRTYTHTHKRLTPCDEASHGRRCNTASIREASLKPLQQPWYELTPFATTMVRVNTLRNNHGTS